MSYFTKILHRQNYPAIDAAAPENSQTGKNILITGGTATIGRNAAERFIKAGAENVVITSRSLEKASTVAKELEAAGNGTKVRGYQYEIDDELSVNTLWDDLVRDGVQIDILVLNATANVPTAQDYKPSLSKFWPIFESGVKNQLINVERFQNHGKKEDKVLLYISTNAIHFSEIPPHYASTTSSRGVVTRYLQDLAIHTPPSTMQILSIHPGFVFTPTNAVHGLTQESLPFDDASLPGNFYVWASTKHAAFLHGRFVWANWDVDELIAMKPKIEGDKGLLRTGVNGLEPAQTFEMLLLGMGRAMQLEPPSTDA